MDKHSSLFNEEGAKFYNTAPSLIKNSYFECLLKSSHSLKICSVDTTIKLFIVPIKTVETQASVFVRVEHFLPSLIFNQVHQKRAPL